MVVIIAGLSSHPGGPQVAGLTRSVPEILCRQGLSNLVADSCKVSLLPAGLPHP